MPSQWFTVIGLSTISLDMTNLRVQNVKHLDHHSGNDAQYVKQRWTEGMRMADIKTLLEIEMYNAEFECKAKHGCRNGADCYKCELLQHSCVKGYVADKLLEKFDISVKNGERKDNE
jgi:hypothetical protein